jgi:hypothetical protein
VQRYLLPRDELPFEPLFELLPPLFELPLEPLDLLPPVLLPPVFFVGMVFPLVSFLRAMQAPAFSSQHPSSRINVF